MNSHEGFSELDNLLTNKEFVEKLSPKFVELSLDVSEVLKQSNDPKLIAVLLFKLVEERQKTNQLLEKIHEKFDEVLKKIDSQTIAQQAQFPVASPTGGELLVLPEQDQLILHHVKEKGQVTAEEIRKELGYKGNNAASQRLNKLFREGHLRKIQAGRKVLYLARNIS